MSDAGKEEQESERAQEIVSAPRPFRFERREVGLCGDSIGELLALEPLGDHPTDVVAVDESLGLYRVNLKSGESRRVLTLTGEQLRGDAAVSLVTSRDGHFAAVTRGGVLGEDSFNSGVVIDLESEMPVLTLSCGDYRVNHTVFPVAFVERDGRTLVIHGTDWNRVDVSDPRTGECLTQREEKEAPEGGETVFTEWLGEMRVSPDQTRVATIGWMWHPVGHAFSWSLDDWLWGHPWEPDHGESKRSFAIWEYFWFSPFFWYDNETLCIWGDPELMGDRDVPPNTVVFYSAETGERLRSFPGPAMEGFFFDRYLFTGVEEGTGLQVWDLDKGALLHTEPGITARIYHPGTAEFVEVGDNGWVAWGWEPECE